MNPFDKEGIEQLRAAGVHLAMDAPGLVNGDPHLAMVALVLAAGHVAAILRFPYEALVKLISDHYEYVLLQEVEKSLEGSGDVMVSKPKERV